MSVHRNAALSLRQRERLVLAVAAGMTITGAALVCGCSRQTASKWVARFRAGQGLHDRSSRPQHSPRRSSPLVEQRVLTERARSGLGPHPIGWQLGLAPSTVHAILQRHGASRRNRQPPEPVVRYERQRPGELLHIDVKKIGRIKRPLDPHSGRPVGGKGNAGWDYLFVCDCQRFYHRHGISISEVLTDNGKCFKRRWHQHCAQLAITPRHTRVRRPQTNGKAERFIRTLQDECLRRHTYTSNPQRINAILDYLHHYNNQRRHRALNGQTPAQRASTTSLGHTTRFQNFRTRCDCTRSAQAPLRDAPNACRHLPRRRALDRRGADLQGRQGLRQRRGHSRRPRARGVPRVPSVLFHAHALPPRRDLRGRDAHAGHPAAEQALRGLVQLAPRSARSRLRRTVRQCRGDDRAARRPATGVHRREPAFSAMAMEQRRPGVPVRYTVAMGRRAGIWFGYAESDSGLGGSRPFARSSSSADSVFSGESPIAART